MDPAAIQTAAVLCLLPVAARVAGLLLVAPIFGSEAVPVRLRIFLALVVATAVAPQLPPAPAPMTLWELALACGLEMGIGAAIGWAAALLFAGLELAAVHVAAQMGLALGETMSGMDEEQSGPVASLFRIVAIAVFLLIGGHRELLSGLLDSLRTLPAGGLDVKGGVLVAAAGLLQASFLLALKVAAPVLIAMLLATVAMGMLTRLLPSCHILSTDLPIRAMVGLLFLALSVAGVAWAVQAAWTVTKGMLPNLLGGMG